VFNGHPARAGVTTRPQSAHHIAPPALIQPAGGRACRQAHAAAAEVAGTGWREPNVKLGHSEKLRQIIARLVRRIPKRPPAPSVRRAAKRKRA
jgi:hypothetical protein